MRSTRALALTLVSASAAMIGCASPADNAVAAQSDITDVPVTPVINQGQNDTCWMYATSAWLESLHIAAAGTSPHYSPAYLEYWYFYNQIVGRRLSAQSQVYQTGYWGWAGNIIQARGVVPLGKFSDHDAVTEYQAFETVNAKLKSGAFGAPGQMPNAAGARAILDSAFGLSASESALLTQVFGADGSTTFAKGAVAAGDILAPHAVAVKTPVAGQGSVATTLDAVIGTWAGGTHTADDRAGALAWSGAYPPAYPGFQSFMGDVAGTAGVAGANGLPPLPEVDPTTWRPMLQRIQRALNDGAPVPILWEEVPADADATGTFRAGASALPTSTGSHVTLLTDYQISNVPGFGTLYAGVQATPAQMAASLDNGALVDFLRAKNSWGVAAYADAAVAGYVDLDLAYLMQPMYLCDPAHGDLSQPTSAFCVPRGPMLWDVVLPPGY